LQGGSDSQFYQVITKGMNQFESLRAPRSNVLVLGEVFVKYLSRYGDSLVLITWT
jgi:hypothetical protein